MKAILATLALCGLALQATASANIYVDLTDANCAVLTAFEASDAGFNDTARDFYNGIIFGAGIGLFDYDSWVAHYGTVCRENPDFTIRDAVIQTNQTAVRDWE